MSKLTRRAFLGACAASAAALAASQPAYAFLAPVTSEAAGFQNYTSTVWQNYLRRVGPSMTAAEMSTVTAAANDGLATVAARVGARTGVGMLGAFVASANPIVAGLFLGAAVIGAAYLAYRYITPSDETGGKNAATSIETADAFDRWSLYGKPGWSLWKQTNLGSGRGYQAWWLWTPPSGQTSSSFDPATHLKAYQKPVASAAVAASMLDQMPETLPVLVPWQQEALTNLAIDSAKKAQAAGTPLPGPFADPAAIPPLLPADFPEGSTDLPAPGARSYTQPLPDAVTKVIATPTPGQSANPSPSPSPSPSPAAGGAQAIDWGPAPSGAMPTAPQPFSWVPSPWVAPDLPGSCSGLPYNFPALKASGSINPCPVIAQARPIVRPVAVLGWTAYAIAQFLDL